MIPMRIQANSMKIVNTIFTVSALFEYFAAHGMIKRLKNTVQPAIKSPVWHGTTEDAYFHREAKGPAIPCCAASSFPPPRSW
jgi:hypothetical protein